MAVEIEHKYLVKDESYKDAAEKCVHIRQGYLSRIPERTVRVRIKDDRGYITVKGRNSGDFRLEFEYEVPAKDAEEMLGMCEGTVLEKCRWLVPFDGYTWEVDEYVSPEFPTVAEVELPESRHDYPIPPFAGEEVTGDPRYYNSNIH